MSNVGPVLPRPPANVAPYVDVLGIDLTATFLLQFGGAELYLADDPKGKGRLEALVGYECAKALAANGHLLQRRVPLAKPWLSRYLAFKGYSTAEIARTVRASDVSVRGWISAGR